MAIVDLTNDLRAIMALIKINFCVLYFLRRQTQLCPTEKIYRSTPSNTNGSIAEVTIRRSVFF